LDLLPDYSSRVIHMRIGNRITKTGFFDIPEYFKKKVPGTLIIESDGNIIIEVIEPEDHITKIFEDHREIPTIKAKTEGYEYILIENCFMKPRETSYTDGINKRKIEASSAILSQTEIEEKQLYENILFSVDLLEEWVNKFKIITNYNHAEQVGKIDFSVPESISHLLTNKCTFEIHFGFENTVFQRSSDSVSIDAKTYIKLSHEEPKTLETLRKDLFIIISFLSILMDDTVSIRSLYALPHYNDDIENRERRYCKILSRTYPYKDKEPKKSSLKMLLTYEEIEQIEGGLSKILSNFYSIYEKTNPSINNILGPKFNNSTTQHDWNFLSVMRGIESYERSYTPVPLEEKHCIDEFIERTLNSCEPKHRKWLESKIAHSSERTLTKKMVSFLSRVPSELLSKTKRGRLISKSTNRRNLLTHAPRGLSNTESIENHFYHETIYMMSIIVILGDIGIDQKTLVRIFMDNRCNIKNRIDAFKTKIVLDE